MGVCVHVCVCVPVCACMHVHEHVHVHECVHACVYIGVFSKEGGRTHFVVERKRGSTIHYSIQSTALNPIPM